MYKSSFFTLAKLSVWVLLLTLVTGTVYSQTNLQPARIPSINPIGIPQGVATGGDLLFVEFKAKKFRVWSINPTNSSTVTAPQWINIVPFTYAAISVNNASGLYLTASGPTKYRKQFSGSFLAGDTTQSYDENQSLPGSSDEIKLGSGAIPTLRRSLYQTTLPPSLFWKMQHLETPYHLRRCVISM